MCIRLPLAGFRSEFLKANQAWRRRGQNSVVTRNSVHCLRGHSAMDGYRTPTCSLVPMASVNASLHVCWHSPSSAGNVHPDKSRPAVNAVLAAVSKPEHGLITSKLACPKVSQKSPSRPSPVPLRNAGAKAYVSNCPWPLRPLPDALPSSMMHIA